MSTGLRLRRVAHAAFFGWLVGCGAVLPVKIYEAVRTISFVPGIAAARFGELLCLSIALWAVITFAFVCYGCCVFLFPAVWILSAARIVAHRSLWVAVNIGYGFALIALRAHIWTAFAHDGVGFENFWIWAVFACTSFAVAAELYARQARKILASSSGRCFDEALRSAADGEQLN